MATIAILGTGDMGSGLAGAWVQAGHRVVSPLRGRSEHSRGLAAQAGIEDVGELGDALEVAEFFLSVMPPAAAAGFARLLCAAAQKRDASPLFVDCNAVSPRTICGIAEVAVAHGIRCVDAGIVGLAPRQDRSPVHFYVSGPEADAVTALATADIEVRPIGDEIGKASALKMAYASLTKGTHALRSAALIAGHRLGVAEELDRELRESQAPVHAAMQRIRHLGADAVRWGGEMRQIAQTYADLDMTPSFHEGAEWIYDLFAETPMSTETRANLDLQRTVDEAIEQLDAALERRKRLG